MKFIINNMNVINAILMVIAGVIYTDIYWKMRKKYKNKYSDLRSALLGFPVFAFAISAFFLFRYQIETMRDFWLMLALLPAKLSKVALMYWVNGFHKRFL